MSPNAIFHCKCCTYAIRGIECLPQELDKRVLNGRACRQQRTHGSSNKEPIIYPPTLSQENLNINSKGKEDPSQP
jgi:hypothetical protein